MCPMTNAADPIALPRLLSTRRPRGLYFKANSQPELTETQQEFEAETSSKFNCR